MIRRISRSDAIQNRSSNINVVFKIVHSKSTFWIWFDRMEISYTIRNFPKHNTELWNYTRIQESKYLLRIVFPFSFLFFDIFGHENRWFLNYLITDFTIHILTTLAFTINRFRIWTNIRFLVSEKFFSNLIFSSDFFK